MNGTAAAVVYIVRCVGVGVVRAVVDVRAVHIVVVAVVGLAVDVCDDAVFAVLC